MNRPLHARICYIHSRILRLTPPRLHHLHLLVGNSGADLQRVELAHEDARRRVEGEVVLHAGRAHRGRSLLVGEVPLRHDAARAEGGAVRLVEDGATLRPRGVVFGDVAHVHRGVEKQLE